MLHHPIKTIKICVSTLLLLATLPLFAETRDGNYVTVFGGAASVPNNIANLGFSQAKYRSGFDFGAALGYQSGPLHYEGELNYIRANVKNFRINNANAISPTGHTASMAAMANIYYDFDKLTDIIVPFLGGGIGFARVKATLDNQHITVFSQSNTELAYQGVAGLNVNLGQNIALNVSYRYFTTLHSDNLNKRFQAHMGNIGIIYRYNLSSE